MTNLRARIRQIEKNIGGNGKPEKVKIYVGDICPDRWPPAERYTVEEQMELIEAGIRGYLCFEDYEQAAEYGFADASPMEQDELDSADIDISEN